MTGLRFFFIEMQLKFDFSLKFSSHIKPKNLTMWLPIRWIDRSYWKTYWSIINNKKIKRFLNNKKISIIPPVFFEGKVVFDFEKKAELFNNNFALQWTLVKNASIYQTLNIKRWMINLFWNKNENYMKNFQASKAHRWDKILIRMVKLWGNSYSIKTNIPISESMLVMGVFLDECKNKRLNAIHKRESKNLIKNYRPIYQPFPCFP